MSLSAGGVYWNMGNNHSCSLVLKSLLLRRSRVLITQFWRGHGLKPLLTFLEDLALTFISCEDDTSCVLYVPPGVDHEAFTSGFDVVERHLSVRESRGTESVLYPVVSPYHCNVLVVYVSPETRVQDLCNAKIVYLDNTLI